MFKTKAKTASQSKITKNSQITAQAKPLTTQLNKKQRLAKSQLRLKSSQAQSVIALHINSGQRGKTIQFLQTRRESILNSQYNLRKNKLITITKENKKIYQRINSQKSNYSSRVLNKSYDSMCSNSSRISQRSSRSKTMNINSNSRNSSIKNSRYQNEKKKVGKPESILKVHSINTVKQEQLINFHKVFLKNVPTQPIKSILTLTPDQNQNQMSSIQQQQNQNQHTKSTKKLSILHFTPDRAPKIKITEKYHRTTIGLPEIKEKETTPHRKGNLERVIDSLGYRYRY